MKGKMIHSIQSDDAVMRWCWCWCWCYLLFFALNDVCVNEFYIIYLCLRMNWTIIMIYYDDNDYALQHQHQHHQHHFNDIGNENNINNWVNNFIYFISILNHFHLICFLIGILYLFSIEYIHLNIFIFIFPLKIFVYLYSKINNSCCCCCCCANNIGKKEKFIKWNKWNGIKLMWIKWWEKCFYGILLVDQFNWALKSQIWDII